MRVGSLVCVALAWGCAAHPPPEDEAPAPGPGYAASLQLICDVDRLSGADPNDPLEQSRVREDYLLEHVKDPDGIYFLTVFRTKDEKQQSELLAKESASAGIRRCPLVASLTPDP